MNFKIKHTFSSLILSSFAIGGLVSCDGEDQSRPIQTRADILASTAPSEASVIANDLIRYQTNNSSEPFLGSLTFAGDTTTIGDVTYDYAKTGTFLLELRVKFDATNALSTAFDNVLKGNLGAPLASRIRQLLIRPLPSNFTPAELQEIADILNAGGANIQVNSDNTGLRIPLDQTYRHLVTTTVGDRNQGSMGGSYVLESIGTKIIFRVGTDVETSQYRFFEDGLIPIISSIPFVDSEDEIGTFSMEFTNPSS